MAFYKAGLALTENAIFHPNSPIPALELARIKRDLESTLEFVEKYDLPFEQALLHSRLALTFDNIY